MFSFLIIPCLFLAHLSQSVAVQHLQNDQNSGMLTSNYTGSSFSDSNLVSDYESDLSALSAYPDLYMDALFWFGKSKKSKSNAISKATEDVIASLESGKVAKDYRKQVTLRKGGKLPEKANIKIMGPMDSGTNFIFELSLLNDIPAQDCHYGTECPKNYHLGWKHWPLQAEPIEMKDDKSRFNIMVVRHPLSWLLSIKKTPYDVSCEMWQTFSNCNLDVSHEMDNTGKTFSPQSMKIIGKNQKIEFKNLIGLWNMYARGYLNTEIPGIIVRYEDFLTAPSTVLNSMKTELGISKNKKYVPMLKPAKINESCKGFDAAKKYNLNKQFIEDYDHNLLEHIKAVVDKDAMEQLGYSF